MSAVPSPWQELWTDDGYPYYYNPETDTTQWEMPVAAPRVGRPSPMPGGSGR